MNIILIGYRCTGKTSVGRRIAVHMGIPFYDTDELIQRQVGKTIREMVEEEGWDAFRAQERAIIKKLPASADAVIAAGGGAIMDPENRKSLKHNGLFVWLIADVKTIVERMRDDRTSDAQRPPLSGHSLEQETTEVLEARKPIYRALADCTIDTSGKGIAAIADEILSALSRCRLDEQRSRAT